MALDITALDFEGMIGREWLITNGIGGYANTTVCGMNTRKYHGLLVAAMSPPVRRMVLLSHVDELVITNHGATPLGCNEYPGTISPQGWRLLRAFSAEPFPRWAYQGEGFTIEKSVRLLEGENTVCLSYSLLAGDQQVSLEIRPLLAMRSIHELMYQWNARLAAETTGKGRIRIPASTRTPEVFFAHDGGFFSEPYWYLNSIYRREQERGYAGLEDLWTPGAFRWTLSPGQTVHLVCSSEPVEMEHVNSELRRMGVEIDRRTADAAATELDANLDALFHAADAFIVTNPADASRPVGVIGQFPWSSPNARSALAGFAGLFLVTGKIDHARRLLLGLAAQMRDGLIPTEFSEDGQAPKYNGADTSLWFINAIALYDQASGDEPTLRALLPAVQNIIDSYRRGTWLGIGVDADGLVFSRASGVATSWMDAKTGDRVITPRAGRPVELNALWYNALRIAAGLADRFALPQLALEWNELADRTSAAFNVRFWNPQFNWCFDVVEDDASDASLRPNQVLAMSLPHPVLAQERHALVLHALASELLTPMGLRTLSPRDPNYRGKYGGNVAQRDESQHQGSAHPWLLGPLTTAYLRVHGRRPACVLQVRQWLDGCINHLRGDGLGQLPELFDGDPPQKPGGAIACALSVAEILRAYAQGVLGIKQGDATRSPAPLRMPMQGSETLTKSHPE